MQAQRSRFSGILAAFVLSLVAPATAQTPRSAEEVLGPRIDTSGTLAIARPAPRPRVDALRFWNGVAIDASGLDHTPVAPGEVRTFGEQLGPGRASRAMAIVHIAMFEALNSIAGNYQGILGLPRAPFGASADAALAQAAHDTLVAMFPSQKGTFDQALASELARVRFAFARRLGVAVGGRAASAILAVRANDGAAHAEPRMGSDYVPDDAAGTWRQDPISLVPIALGGHWGEVDPFVIPSPSHFRVPAPPALSSPAYAAAYNEVQTLGGDGVTTPTLRSADQTHIGIYWAYDGTPSLCAPPRLYNQIAVQIAKQRGSSLLETARLLALVNVAMADAGIAIWESKYYYHYWRPVTGIREADAGTGPSGAGDDNPATTGDPTFSPLGAPASNLSGPNFTPPFPAYPSGHAGFGGALFQTLRRFYGSDAIPFTFVSDEFNGATKGNDGAIRPLLPRSFRTLSQAEEENGQSRIYLGIHWSFDKTEGIAQGRKIGDYVYQNLYSRRR